MWFSRMSEPDPVSRHARTAVVAIGGNALSPSGEPATIQNQFRHTRKSLIPIVDFARQGWRVAVVHGNGPQVGDALLRNECARPQVSELPLGVLVASTAGWIGYVLQQSLQNALARVGADRAVATLVTQTVIDPEDPAGMQPRKFIGRPVEPAVAEELRAEGFIVEVDDRGHLRRRVASPAPIRLVEAPLVRRLVEDDVIVIAAGGGGTPVYLDPDKGLEGVDVVIDKDLVAALLAREIRASVLLILTDVDAVYTNWGEPNASPLRRLTTSEARTFLDNGGAGVGSMRPKLRAAVQFVEQGGARAIIAALEDAELAMQGESGTTVVAAA